MCIRHDTITARYSNRMQVLSCLVWACGGRPTESEDLWSGLTVESPPPEVDSHQCHTIQKFHPLVRDEYRNSAIYL